MATYFEASNNNNKVVINDNYRFLYEIGKIDLSAGASNPSFIPYTTIHDQYYYRIMKLNSVNTWYYLNGDWVRYSTEPYDSIVFARVVLVNKNNLYGLRFKKTTTIPNCFVHMTKSPIGAMITDNANVSSLFIVIMCNSSSFTPADAINNYFEIVEIGNDNGTIPSCNSGIEVYNATGQTIWNSNCKMIDIKSAFSGNLAGSYSYSGFTTKHIVIPSRAYKMSDWRTSGANRYSAQNMDFWGVQNGTLVNRILKVQGKNGYQTSPVDPSYIWEVREFGTDFSNDKQIAGLICHTQY